MGEYRAFSQMMGPPPGIAGRYPGTVAYLAAHWPRYLVLYGGGALFAVLVVLISTAQGWWAFVPFMLAFLLVLSYFLGAQLWAAIRLFDSGDVDFMFAQANLAPQDESVLISLGRRRAALQLSRSLTSGHLYVVDVYNPQLVPSSAIARARYQAPVVYPDSRVSWGEGDINLLPLPDNSVEVVLLHHLLSAFWQHGDRVTLLREISRVLAPNGRLVLAERMRSQTNLVTLGPLGWRLPTPRYYYDMMAMAGFVDGRDFVRHGGLVHVLRARKPMPTEGWQMQLKFGAQPK